MSTDFKFELNSKGHIRNRESFNLEFKESFHFGDSLIEYLRSMVGMANHKGGKIIFGIKDKPHIPLGLRNDKFQTCDPAKINQHIQKYFSHELDWELNTLEFDGKQFGQIDVSESNLKPIICKTSHTKTLREGAIYYRYRGETKEIHYSELSKILQEEKEKEKKLWMSLIDKIGTVGPQHIHLLDTYTGEIEIGDGKVLLDKNVVDKLKFIKEGQFSEKEGAPTLRLVGDITGIVDPEMSIPSDKVYPYTTKELQEKLVLNQYEMRCIIWKLNIKGNPKYHTEIRTGNKSNPVNKYSEELFRALERMMTRDKFLDQCKEEYQGANPVKRKSK